MINIEVNIACPIAIFLKSNRQLLHQNSTNLVFRSFGDVEDKC